MARMTRSWRAYLGLGGQYRRSRQLPMAAALRGTRWSQPGQGGRRLARSNARRLMGCLTDQPDFAQCGGERWTFRPPRRVRSAGTC